MTFLSLYFHVLNSLFVCFFQERMAKIEQEEKEEHERKKREAEKKKHEIEVAEAMAKKRREEDVDDSKMVRSSVFKFFEFVMKLKQKHRVINGAKKNLCPVSYDFQ